MSIQNNHPLNALIAVMRRLRDPDGGCPWDLAQDFASIAPHTIEEAYEVANAITRGDMKDLREELGDLLLQPVYHAQMASEAGLFDIDDVIRDITAKMIARHPHVFGEEHAASPADVDRIWDERKDAEKPRASALDGVAKALPALTRARKLQDRAAKTGFQWPDMSFVLNKMEEELQELREALTSGTIAEKAEELGDLLFVLVNLGRMAGLDPETALRKANDKFERRFKGMEDDFKKENKSISGQSLTDMEAMWNRQKAKESND